MKREDEKILYRALNLFLILFLVIGILLGGTVAFLYRSDLNTFLTELKVREAHSIQLQSTAISHELDTIVSDVLFLSTQNELINFLDYANTSQRTDIEKEYVRLATTKKVYDQIRFLSADGMETFRVNDNAGSPKPVLTSALQDKSKRYYFTECFALGEQDIFVSPFDLNVENGKVERPFKPMIRLGTPVFDSTGTKRGIVLLNYTANRLLERISGLEHTSDGDNMLLNSDGYWLLNADKEMEWGFMFDDRADRTFAKVYPDEWQRILDQGKGQFQTDNGLFTFQVIYPLEGYRSSTEIQLSATPAVNMSQYFWVMISHTAPTILKEHRNALMSKLFLGGGGVFLLIAFGAWHLAMAITRRRMYQSQLIAMAMYDPLTGLPNRKLFFDKLTAGIAHAKRHERKLGLLYIDLDGFKSINDTMGHQAGDELLIKVGKVLSRLVRKSDTVARLGGDEFAIVLSEIKDISNAARVGEKVVDKICRPFKLKAGKALIGASVGVAVYPDHEEQETQLVKAADKAMYQSKAQGKNTCTISFARNTES